MEFRAAPASARHLLRPASHALRSVGWLYRPARGAGVERFGASRLHLTPAPPPQHAGYWLSTSFLSEVDKSGETTFYDPVTGKPLFVAPRGRSWAAFEKESRSHGWPSFRDEEVIWDDVRVLPDGECVSTAGTHLGHNLPDRSGNRYCVNLVSVAGKPVA